MGIRKLIICCVAVMCCIGGADAAVRSTDSATRNVTQKNVRNDTSARSATSRSAARSVTSRAVGTTSRSVERVNSVARTAINSGRNSDTRKKTNARVAVRSVPDTSVNIIARAATGNTVLSQTFGSEYADCRDAYFTCMDQFCAQQNESYRRCVCSSRLLEVQDIERRLSRTSDSLQDFNNLNMTVVDKTAGEVSAMMNATVGEVAQSSARDKSDSAKQLAGISAVLANTKSKAMSTSGKLDIGGDIKAIWSTTDLAGGANIADLTGEKLYNAVHNQCVEMVRETCGTDANLNMVVSAYGMYIENDCATLITSLDKKVNAANTTIRETEKQLHTARLENYDKHNATPIHDCIANVRADITSNTACGSNYVHCLDMTGKYLNYDTGEPIYTAQFYQLNDMISMDGDILNNNRNADVVAGLNSRRIFAEHSLDTCRDNADMVWNEFMRQAIGEIYQGQQARIRQVKNECLDVVSQCYDEQNQQLKDFSNVKEQLLLGSRLELSEQMCQEKMDACSNLYGNGEDGLHELLIAMHDIVDRRIARDCLSTLQTFVQDLCGVTSLNTTHKYPYACRSYESGDELNAADKCCNGSTSDDCANISCGSYNNSLYKQIVEYAKQVCVRPSVIGTAGYVLPTSVLADVNSVMDSVRTAMIQELSPECENQSGMWVSSVWIDERRVSEQNGVYVQIAGSDGYHDNNAHELLSGFYTAIGASTSWGYCAKSTVDEQMQSIINQIVGVQGFSRTTGVRAMNIY